MTTKLEGWGGEVRALVVGPLKKSFFAASLNIIKNSSVIETNFDKFHRKTPICKKKNLGP